MKPDFEIDSRSAIPVYQQIKQEIRRMVLAGAYKVGDQLIPIRELAKQLQVNPNTIVKVYYQLDVEGYIQARPGQGYFVSELDDDKKGAGKRELFLSLIDDFLFRLGELGYSPDDLSEELFSRKG